MIALVVHVWYVSHCYITLEYINRDFSFDRKTLYTSE